MSEIHKLLTIIYNKFYLRDLFGKIVPGLVLFLSIYIAVDHYLHNIGLQLNWILIIILLGSSWVLGFCVQSFGESIFLIRYYTKNYNTESEFYKCYILFQDKASTSEKENLERLVVIKEACGNYCSTLITGGIFVHFVIWNAKGFCFFINCLKTYWSLYLIAAFITVFLYRMHREHVKKQCELMETVLKKEA